MAGVSPQYIVGIPTGLLPGIVERKGELLDSIKEMG